MSGCPRMHLPFPRCKFVAAYDDTPPDAGSVKLEGSANGLIGMVKAMTKREFKGTYCVRCGRKGEQ